MDVLHRAAMELYRAAEAVRPECPPAQVMVRAHDGQQWARVSRQGAKGPPLAFDLNETWWNLSSEEIRRRADDLVAQQFGWRTVFRGAQE
jgi:hypothetical protein